MKRFIQKSVATLAVLLLTVLLLPVGLIDKVTGGIINDTLDILGGIWSE